MILWWKRGRLERRDWLRLPPFLAVGLAFAGLAVYMEKTYVGERALSGNMSLAGRCLIAGRALFFYAGKLCWPRAIALLLSALGNRPLCLVAVPVSHFGGGPDRGAVASARPGRARAVGRGADFCHRAVSALLGFFNVYPFRFSFVADHYQYHACIALLALAAAATEPVVARVGRRSTLTRATIAVVLLLPLAILARERTYVFQNNTTVDADIVSLNAQPETAVPAVCDDQQRAHQNLGASCREQGKFEEAISHFKKAIEFRERLIQDGPEVNKYRDLVAAGFVDMGMLQSQLGSLPAAEDSFRKAIEIRQQLLSQQSTNAECRHAWRRHTRMLPRHRLPVVNQLRPRFRSLLRSNSAGCLSRKMPPRSAIARLSPPTMRG